MIHFTTDFLFQFEFNFRIICDFKTDSNFEPQLLDLQNQDRISLSFIGQHVKGQCDRSINTWYNSRNG